ncbi:MAG: DUF3099 domain-containing protein [Propionibacteriaceae bacterium]
MKAKSDRVVITDAKTAGSVEQAGRERRYLLAMGFRVACFIAMIWVPGVFRWILLGCAIVIPYLAVILANAANREQEEPQNFGHPEPGAAPAVSDGAETIESTSEEDETP